MPHAQWVKGDRIVRGASDPGASGWAILLQLEPESCAVRVVLNPQAGEGVAGGLGPAFHPDSFTL